MKLSLWKLLKTGKQELFLVPASATTEASLDDWLFRLLNPVELVDIWCDRFYPYLVAFR